MFLTFRDALIAAPTIEAAYLRLATGDVSGTPPLFMTQLVHVILRNALHDCTDAATVRAAELFFRPQRVTHHDNTILLADAEAIETGRISGKEGVAVGLLRRVPKGPPDVECHQCRHREAQVR